ncbi:Extracellular membrane protein, CFEM domain [Penicillium digitatum]|uniref:CFEM domain-containing protein n=3 Tax=Penicillium digitatum TaxID=36651 RepID=K9G7G4_PEND2|nr:hypothetical protein PDIP_38800 [Penicillium digitatum Pd1]EKV15805.1 hypothetical protein PDIP_38800 [Penicillium digitatum Pd1]EKV17870.1 hypothetical protein PDIG_12580 [Penicillium digitatum PHI26]KAG0153671.1 hypothetical protein PDIDSM_2325 [Penicillium digitatum]QQK42324.1 Extracellular membrane protein, CFEM domain [Penicillium digitatum]
MKFTSTLIAFVAAGLASAQLPNVPACSLSCFLSSLQGDGCSELLDFKCHCQKPELISSIAPCVQKACDHKDQVAVSSVVVDQCSSAGHPISIPPIETSASFSASAPETTSTSSSIPVETGAKTTASESSSAVESSSTVKTESSSTSAARTIATGSTHVGSSSGVATSTPLVTKTGSAPVSSSSPAFNGAANVKGHLAGAAALAAAAVYVL